MAATAPVCNVTVTSPAADPTAPKGFRILPPNATLQDVISAFNYNFSPQVQDAEFNRRLAQDLGMPTTSFRIAPSRNQIPKAMDDRIKRINFVEKAIVRKKIKVENPKDKEQWIIDDRVVSLVMLDKTGATWVWKDTKTGDANGQGNPDTTISGG